ncbi:MAG: WD domain-containing protein, G-beta repeat-containing protein [Candidatus Kentron sp. G]|nr:MAG: WD domain-containing protein, G-beta repeat-containing protein [Candidatus Kentron sp. G]VFM97039.1 MAG: WD domain-containing protein, G-beta repeat-containing protein [Candidatus Kentron sp. G]VFM99352.1 MAG: WD domain-containing protein, G-beta repeat-containing protein [Candidatus Kentron sp. G]
MPALLLLFLALAAPPLLGAGPPTEPILRLENGRHTAAITRIATDAQGRWIASVSLDKTLRLWDAASGRLLRTWRLPIGAGNEGQLRGVAMAPKGDWIAVGGWTAGGTEDAIYLLDRASGRFIERLGGLENVILHLCASPDGRWLGASLGGANGVRVFDAAKIDGQYRFRQVFADRDYGSDSYGCAFGPDSRRLVTSSWDGKLRLYRHSAGGFKRIGETRLSGGEKPYAVAFHPHSCPSSSRVVVGFADTTAVQVLDGLDLTPRYAAGTADIGNGNLGNVAWSADGTKLFAGGKYWDGSGYPVLGWTGGGRGLRFSWRAADSTVMAIGSLPGGRLAVGTGDPALLAFDALGEKLMVLRPRIADLRDQYGHFRLSGDGQQVAFGLKQWGKERVRFDLANRRLERDGINGVTLDITSLAAPRTETPELTIGNWKHKYDPTLNGEPLALDQHEMSRSLAIAPDGERFVLGADWSLRLFDGQGRELWRRAAPNVAWGVNISNDGRLVVAAFGGGTIGWYRLADGAPLLSLFVTNDGEDWVLWSPSGYYDASPGGDRLIGWHMNNGKDALADFYPVGEMRGCFYRPEVVAEVLTELDEAKALAKAGQPATPVSPKDCRPR